jgi:hypothetical protein
VRTAVTVSAAAPVEPSRAADGAEPEAHASDHAAMEMHYVPVDKVKAHLHAHGLAVVDAALSGGDGTFEYQRYVVRKPRSTPFAQKLSRRLRRFSRR